MRNILPRLAAAIPDTITAATCLTAWIAPALIGPAGVADLIGVIAIEFFVMHASALYGMFIAKRDDRLDRRATILGVLTLFYLVPIGGFALFMKSLVPIYSFFWLFTSRFAFVIVKPETAVAESERVQVLWGVSLTAYLGILIFVSMLPLPALGLTPDFVASLPVFGNPGPKGKPPQFQIAFLMLYFIVQACAKAWLVGRSKKNSPQASPA